MTTTYIVYEVKHSPGTPTKNRECEGADTLAEAEEIAARYQRWYIVEMVETERSFTRAVVARSPDPEPAPYLQRAAPKVSKLERARARMAKGVR